MYVIFNDHVAVFCYPMGKNEIVTSSFPDEKDKQVEMRSVNLRKVCIF